MLPMLSDHDRTLLDFEARVYKSRGAKERDIRRELGLSLIAYHSRLARLMRDPEAIEYAPAVTRRARERVEARHGPVDAA